MQKQKPSSDFPLVSESENPEDISKSLYEAAGGLLPSVARAKEKRPLHSCLSKEIELA
jgi:hypothetical protein